MRIVLLGPPGSGKGTQAALLVEQLGITHISTGALLRDAAERGTELGLQAKTISDKGELVPDSVISDMLEERLHYMMMLPMVISSMVTRATWPRQNHWISCWNGYINL